MFIIEYFEGASNEWYQFSDEQFASKAEAENKKLHYELNTPKCPHLRIYKK